MEKAEKNGFALLLPQYRVMEGFDPNDLLVEIEEVDSNGQPANSLYLDFIGASSWFFTVFPNGAMEHVFVERTPKKATVTACIYRDVNDARPAMKATCSREYDETKHGKFYEQNAVTAAYRKALDYLGFRTPQDAHVTEYTRKINPDEVPEQGEPGVIIPPPIIPTVLGNADKEATTSGELVPHKEEKDKAVQTVQTPISGTTPNAIANTQKPAKQTLFDGVLPTPEQAASFKIPYGSMAGITIEDAFKKKGKGFVRYHCDRAEKDSDFGKAIQVFCENNAC